MNELVSTLLVNSAVFSILFGAMLLVRKLFAGRMSAALRYALWAAVAVKLLLPFGFESSLSPLGWFAEMPAQASVRSAPPVSLDTPISPAPYMPAGELPLTDYITYGVAAEPPQPAAHTDSPPIRLGPADWAALGWALGAAATGGWMLACMAFARRRMRRHRAAASRRVMRTLEGCKQELGIRRSVRVRMQANARVPAIMGLFRPTILLPAGAEKLGDAALRHILLHELAHYRHGHLPVIHLMNLLAAVYWFNPFVWLCFRLVRRDMETICDQQVLRLVGREGQDGYVRTILNFSAAPDAGKLRAALAMGSGRAHMERRIREMFRRRRSGRGMRFAAAAVALAMLASGALTACRPTPTKPAVAGKDGARLEELIQSTQRPRDPAQAQAPAAYKDSFSGADESVTVDIDAVVTTPGCALPVIEVRPRTITMEDIRAAAAVLFRGEKVYEPQIGLTKADVQKKIVELKKIIADEKALLDSCFGDREMADKVKAQYEEQLAAYEKLAPFAPETIVRRETDWAFHPESYYMDPVEFAADPSASSRGQMFKAIGTVDGYHAFIQALNFDMDDWNDHRLGFVLGRDLSDNGYYPRWRFSDDTPLKMTSGEAAAFALDALGRMGFGDMRLVSCKALGKPDALPGNLTLQERMALAAGGLAPESEPAGGPVYSYSMTFVPAYHGVPLLHTGQNVSEGDAYSPVYFYEEVRVLVKDGLIISLDWDSPLEEVRVENADVAALTFAEAVEAFKAYMKQAYTLEHLAKATLEYDAFAQYEGRVESGTVTITDIRLGLMRIRVMDKPNAYRLVPAWMFKGTEHLKMMGEDKPVLGMRSDWRDGPYAYAVINALDGSIIDPAKGY